ncbi:hypothetical protein PRUPE_1G212600 [Prunus persica]|uniref:Uncharacterized protein n=1 Tax=Prunus persica TaxID=3760 RepID=A0A251R164_PRUPE|nr:hypothetical protein PRUPE_1G212600 [Prunus persica]
MKITIHISCIYIRIQNVFDANWKPLGGERYTQRTKPRTQGNKITRERERERERVRRSEFLTSLVDQIHDRRKYFRFTLICSLEVSV